MVPLLQVLTILFLISVLGGAVTILRVWYVLFPFAMPICTNHCRKFSCHVLNLTLLFIANSVYDGIEY